MCFFLDTYIGKLPQCAIEKGVNLCQMCPQTQQVHGIYCRKKSSCKMVPDMCSDAGLVGKKTNHSLRVSGATSLFEAGVPERVIQQPSGHHSLLSLRMYERVSDGQQKAVSRILTGEKSNYNEL